MLSPATPSHLHCDPEPAVDGARRLRADGQVRGPAAAAHRASPAVEQREAHVEGLGHLHQLLLGAEQGPRGSDAPCAGAGPGVWGL
jgi:hypothetical protein